MHLHETKIENVKYGDGRSCWFAYEDAIDDCYAITEVEPEKQAPALRNRLGFLPNGKMGARSTLPLYL